MKKLLLALICLIGMVSVAYATAVVIEFSYEPADPQQAAQSYKVYASGTFVCDSSNVAPGPPAEFECDTSILTTGVAYDFTMTAVFESGAESPHSPGYSFTIPIPPANSPNIFTIRVL